MDELGEMHPRAVRIMEVRAQGNPRRKIAGPVPDPLPMNASNNISKSVVSASLTAVWRDIAR